VFTLLFIHHSFVLSNDYIRQWENTSAVVVMYDISNPETLQSCNKWLGGVRAMRPTGQRMLGVLVGNKADFREDTSMDSRAEITRDEGLGAAKELGLQYFETSAVRWCC
jgi:transport family protein 27